MTKSLKLSPIAVNFTLKDHIHGVLLDAILGMHIYDPETNLRLDERKMAEQLGISRTPIREALVRLEQDGFVDIQPRKGVYVRRKSLDEILEMIIVWAALESMAARLIIENATDEQISSLRKLFATFKDGQVEARIDEYSDQNIAFHQAILDMSGCALLRQMAEGLFLHVKGIRARTIGDSDRAERSIIDHMHIIEALESRDAELADRLVREHTLNLAAHVEKHVDYLD